MKKITLLLALFLVLRPDSLAQTPYGLGTPGAGGLAPLLTSGQPWMGNPAFSVTVSNAVGGGTADSLQVIISMAAGATSGEVARYDLLFDQWIDHNPNQPGIQNIGPQSSPPAAIPSSPYTLDVSGNGAFAVVSGQGTNSGLVRIDLDPNNPFVWGAVPISTPTNFPGGAVACGISGDDTMVATFSSGQLVIFNVMTGALIGQVPLPGSGNVYTVKWF